VIFFFFDFSCDFLIIFLKFFSKEGVRDFFEYFTPCSILRLISARLLRLQTVGAQVLTIIVLYKHGDHRWWRCCG